MTVIDEQGRLRHVSPYTDLFLLLHLALGVVFRSVIEAAAGEDPSSEPVVLLGYAVGFSLLAGGIMLLVLAVVGGIISSMDLYLRTGAKSLPKEAELSFHSSLKELLGPQASSFKRVRFLWAPNDLSVGGRAFGMFTRVIVISGGLWLATRLRRKEAAAVLLHERAHLRSFDPWLTTFLGFLLFANIGIIGISVYQATDALARFSSGGFDLLTVLGTPLVSVLYIRWASVRREYFADGMAINTMENRSDYLAMLGRSGTHRGVMFFHPSVRDRADAASGGTPVASMSWFVLFLFGVELLIMFPRLLSPPVGTWLAMTYLALPAAVAVYEFRKGVAWKRPAHLPELALRVPADDRSSNSQQVGS